MRTAQWRSMLTGRAGSPALPGHSRADVRETRSAVHPFAGTEDLSRSHFETQDSIELGQPVGGRAQSALDPRTSRRDLERASGKAGSRYRFAPRVLSGRDGYSERSRSRRWGKSLRSMRGRRGFLPTCTPARACRPSRMASSCARRSPRPLRSRCRRRIAGAIAPKGFELGGAPPRPIDACGEFRHRLRRYRRLGYARQRGRRPGRLAATSRALGRDLCALSQEPGDEWKNTVVVVLSEFGRTFQREQQSEARPRAQLRPLILGGSIAGGRIAGAQLKIAPGTLFQDRDFPVLNEYRACSPDCLRGCGRSHRTRFKPSFLRPRLLICRSYDRSFSTGEGSMQLRTAALAIILKLSTTPSRAGAASKAAPDLSGDWVAEFTLTGTSNRRTRLFPLHSAADRQHANRHVAQHIGHRLHRQRQDRSAPEHRARQHLHGCSEVGRDGRHSTRAQG